MSRLLNHIALLAADDVQRLAIVCGQQHVSYSTLWSEVQALAEQLLRLAPRCVAVDMQPSLAWLISDLALIDACYPSVPLPQFFTTQQKTHAMRTAGAGWLMTDKPRSGLPLAAAVTVCKLPCWIYALPYASVALHDSTAKITFTSGTTAEPKGVCLSQTGMETIAQSLQDTLGTAVAAHHASIMPLSILLENVAGFYTTLLAGGCYHLQSDSPMSLPDFLSVSQATSCILVPQLLRLLIHQLQECPRAMPHLHYVAVGGAALSPTLLDLAAHVGLPVYQGYGLSESASVACINTPGDNLIGSVGKALPHIALHVSEDGELWLNNPMFLGYVGEDAAPVPYATGDIGWIDASGHVFITGRKKHVLITANGRNISPEWPESILLAHPVIAQAVVVGDAQPYLAALIVSDADDDTIAKTVQATNQTLPEYARIKHWTRIVPLSVENNCLTSTGRPRRVQVNHHYRAVITSLFEREYDQVL